jgi:hypothetical protein
MTYYNPVELDSWNTDGWFMAFVDPADDYLEVYETVENGRLQLSKIINNYYRNYNFTNSVRYKYNNVQETIQPTLFREIIQLEEFETVLDSANVFYDGIIYENSTRVKTGRTMEQRTNLNTNITTFICHEFSNVEA